MDDKKWKAYDLGVSDQIEDAMKNSKKEPVYTIEKGPFKGDQILFDGVLAQQLGTPLVHKNKNDMSTRQMRRLAIIWEREVIEGTSTKWAPLQASCSKELNTAFLGGKHWTSVTMPGGKDVMVEGLLENAVFDEGGVKIHVRRAVTVLDSSELAAVALAKHVRRQASFRKKQREADESVAAWADDDSSEDCPTCKEKFSLFNPKHHCRQCGSLVCGKCSKNKAIVKDGQRDPVRVCDKCFESVLKDSTIAAGEEKTADTSKPATDTTATESSPTPAASAAATTPDDDVIEIDLNRKGADET